jgi:hypothetical protein
MRRRQGCSVEAVGLLGGSAASVMVAKAVSNTGLACHHEGNSIAIIVWAARQGQFPAASCGCEVDPHCTSHCGVVHSSACHTCGCQQQAAICLPLQCFLQRCAGARLLPSCKLLPEFLAAAC